MKKFNESNIYYIEPEFFKIFDFGWLAGNPKNSLTEPNSAVLTLETTEKYFGDWTSAMGKIIKHDNKNIFKITGIMKNVPANTDFPFQILFSYSTLQNSRIKPQLSDSVSTFGQAYTYVVFPPGLSKEKFNRDLRAFAKKHKPAEYATG